MTTFKQHADAGSPVFKEEEGVFTIICKKGERGRFLSENIAVEFNERVRVQADVGGEGEVVLIWWKSIRPYKVSGSARLGGGDVDEILTIPEDTSHMRLELRGWTEGISTFDEVEMVYPLENEPNSPKTPVLQLIDNEEHSDHYQVEWEAVDGAERYRLQVQKDNGAFYDTYYGADTFYAVAGALPGLWGYRVRAENEKGASAWSEIVETRVDEQDSDVESVKLYAIIGAENGEYEVQWETAEKELDVVSYVLQEADIVEGFDPVWIAFYVGPENAAEVKKTAVSKWQYRVQYLYENEEGDLLYSPWSNIEKAIVSAPLPPDVPPGSDEDMYVYELRRPDEHGTAMVRVTLTPESITFFDYDWFDYLQAITEISIDGPEDDDPDLWPDPDFGS